MLFVRYPLISQSFLNFFDVLFTFSYSVKLFFKKLLHFSPLGTILFSGRAIKALPRKTKYLILQGRVQFPTGGTARERMPFGGSMIR